MEEQFQVLFGARFTHMLENATLTLGEGEARTLPDGIIHTHTVTNQQYVIEILNKFVNNSFLNFPCKKNGGMIEKPSREGGNP